MNLSNSIAIGGQIASGRSTVLGSLPFKIVRELDSGDELQSILIQKMYEGEKMAPQLFQLDILLTRFEKYSKHAKSEEMHIFDRTIFEDIFFAEKLLKKQGYVWNYYKSIWEDKVKEIIKNIGLPKIYILLVSDWETFKERLFSRGRESEINNFQRNKEYFKEMVNEYEDYMTTLFKKYNINYHIIDSSKLGKIELIDKVKAVLDKEGVV